MTVDALNPQKTRFRKLSLTVDGWAVVIALALTALVRGGVLKHIPW